MSDSPGNSKNVAYLKDAMHKAQDEMDELRDLLLGSEYQELLTLKAQLKDKESYANNIANVVAEAIDIRSARDQSLSSSLAPSVEEAMQVSVRKDPQPIVDALFPIIGPMIRKSIAEAFKSMIESLDNTLSNSMSIRSIKWRLDAKRTGRSYTEIVLLNTLVYQVEQIFLIHRETGLLLQHVQSDKAIIKDPDMVSGMLTAIQDFIKDSFEVAKSEDLESMQLGELTVLLTHIRGASIAAVVRGTPPSDLRVTLQEASEELQASYAERFSEFSGDTEQFTNTQPILESCLVSQSQQRPKRKPWPAIIVLALIAILIISYSLLQYFERQDWQSAIARLDNEPGIVVVETGKADGDYYVRGLRDDYARQPEDVIGQAFTEDHTVNTRFTPYISVENEIVIEKTRKQLGVPDTVTMQLVDGVLIFSGNAPRTWIKKITPTPFYKGNIAGVNEINLTNVVDLEYYKRMFSTIATDIEQFVVYYREGASELNQTQLDDIDILVSQIKQIDEASRIIKNDYTIRVLGHTDSSGTEELNRKISRARAQGMVALLIERGAPSDILIAEGVSDQFPISEIDKAKIFYTDRRVSLDIVFNNH